jgi:hypothetical protein
MNLNQKPKPINTWEDALNEWQNGDIKNIPAHFVTALIKQLQDEELSRFVDAKYKKICDELEDALAYCHKEGIDVTCSDDAIDAYREYLDSDEYATDQAERKGDDDYTAGKEDW